LLFVLTYFVDNRQVTRQTSEFATKCWIELPRPFFNKKRLKKGGFVFYFHHSFKDRKTGNPGFAPTVGVLLEQSSLDEWLVNWYDQKDHSVHDVGDLKPAPEPKSILEFKDEKLEFVTYEKKRCGTTVKLIVLQVPG
jgi:hypothetical protein